MAIGDIPKFPQAYKPRGEKLIRNLRGKKISAEEVQNHIFSVLGKVSIDADGIKATGDFGSFEIDADGFRAMNESLKRLVNFLSDFLPSLKGRELYIQKGEKITRIKIGRLLLPKIRTGTKGEIDISDLPGIELPSGGGSGAKISDRFVDMLSMYFGVESQSNGDSNGGGNIKIDRIEDLAEWIGEGWEGVVKLLEIANPLIDLTTKEKLDKLGESYPSFWDDVFKRCGV